MRRDRIVRFCLCLILCFTLAFSATPLFTHAAEEDFVDKAANTLREAMVQRQESVTYTYESKEWIFSSEAIGEDGTLTLPQEEVGALLQSIYDRAIAHTGIPNQGDYLRWHIRERAENFSCEYTQEGNTPGNFKYIFQFTISYYTTAQQEADVTEKLKTVLSQLDLAGKTDYEKIKAIYDYICANVVYDNLHLSDPNYNLQYTAYAALIQGTSVCQGYSNLFYRMALEAGLDNRIIIGQSQGTAHAWNIVKLGGVYYHVDSTWDAVAGDYRFFLKTDAHMPEHEADAQYLQPAFLAAYPMATDDYVIPEEPQPTTQPTTAPETQPATVPATQPTTAPETQPATVPATQPTTAPETQPATVPATQPTTAPETQPATVPTTQPTTAPETQPATVPATQPTTAPVTQPVTAPATAPTTPSWAVTTAPSTTNPTTEIATDSTAISTVTQQPTQAPSNSGPQPDEKSTGTWILILGGVTLLAAAAGSAVLLGKKRK